MLSNDGRGIHPTKPDTGPFSFLGSLEVAQIYLPGWVARVGWSHSDYKTNLSSQLNWSTGTELGIM